jgi:hypothetical protein
MTKIVKVNSDEVRAAKIELRALETAGLRPDAYVRQLANAAPLFSDEFGGEPPPEMADQAWPARKSRRITRRSARTDSVDQLAVDRARMAAIAAIASSANEIGHAIQEVYVQLNKHSVALSRDEVEAMSKAVQATLAEETEKRMRELADH